MYKRILVPLDMSEEAERVLPLARDVLAPGGEIILAHVLPLPKAGAVASVRVPDDTRLVKDKQRAAEYLKSALARSGDAERMRFEVLISDSIEEGITEFAAREDIDLIAMYTPDRKGLGKLLKSNVTKNIRRRAPVEVKIFKPRDIALIRPANGKKNDEGPLIVQLLSEVQLFKGLWESEISQIASIAKKASIPADQYLGHAGQPGDKLYIIIEGEAQLSTESSAGDITVRIAGPGESFPLAALVRNGTLITSMKAMTDLEVLEIGRESLAWLCSHNPHIGLQIYKNIADLWAARYESTLKHLAMNVERASQNAYFMANI